MRDVKRRGRIGALMMVAVKIPCLKRREREERTVVERHFRRTAAECREFEGQVFPCIDGVRRSQGQTDASFRIDDDIIPITFCFGGSRHDTDLNVAEQRKAGIGMYHLDFALDQPGGDFGDHLLVFLFPDLHGELIIGIILAADCHLNFLNCIQTGSFGIW